MSDDDYVKFKSDPRYGTVKKFLKETLDELIAERKASKSVPKKKAAPVPTDTDDDDDDENIFDSLFGRQK